MTFTIPVWVLWTLCGVAGLAVLALAAIGCMFLWAFKDFTPFR